MIYKYHSLALNPTEEAQYQKIKAEQKFGIKAIFKAMLNTLCPVDSLPKPKIIKEEEI